MERIGLAASKMAKGNFLLYNAWVIIISFIVSLFIFFIAGSSIFLALMILAYLVSGTMPAEFEKNWESVLRICLLALTVVMTLFNLFAILKNIRLKKPKE